MYQSARKSNLSATGEIDVSLLRYLICRSESGSPFPPSQFTYGLPILGVPPRSYFYPLCAKRDPRPSASAELFFNVGGMFRQWSRIQPRHAESMWLEASGKVSCGRLGHPRALTKGGRLIDSPDEPTDLAFRFPVGGVTGFALSTI